MLLLSAGATLLALIIAGFFIANILERFVIQGVDQRLDAQISLLASSIDKDGKIDEARLAGMAGALDAGRGWRWQIKAPGRTLGFADFPTLDHPPQDRRRREHDEPRPGDGRDRDGGPVHARQLTLDASGGEIVISVIAPRAVIDRPIRAAALPLLLLLAILCAILVAATMLQLRYGLRPLRKMRDDVAAIREGRARAIAEDQPDELRPLALELNALSRDNAAALANARASAANLAHALKTPVAALALELRDSPDQARQIERIDATIRHHLSRARDRIVDRHAATLLAPAAADLAATVARLRPEKVVVFALEIDPALVVAIDSADLDEMLGNLIDNAARHARSTVTVTASRVGRFINLAIADDGPGIPETDRDRALSPGTRLDERGDGHGFGLSIARELAELYGGTLSLAEAAQGGALVEVTLPGATAGIA